MSGHHPTSVEARIDVGCRLIDRLVVWYDSSSIDHVVPAAHPRTDLRLVELTQLLDWSPEWLPTGELLSIAAELIPTSHHRAHLRRCANAVHLLRPLLRLTPHRSAFRGPSANSRSCAIRAAP